LDLENLLKRCRQGDGLAWEALVRRFQGRVYGIARYYLSDREEARDVAQEAFVRIYSKLERFDSGSNFTAWILRITRNCAIDRLRQMRARPQIDASQGDEYIAGVPAPRFGLDTAAGEQHQLVYRALELMSAANREMILLKEIHGLKQHEIAEILSLPLGTVKARTNRARHELARRILELDPTYGTS
jgi:RNA polymerase sigma-70 factor (ECF subfamily)